jgi:hypothetical protein
MSVQFLRNVLLILWALSVIAVGETVAVYLDDAIPLWLLIFHIVWSIGSMAFALTWLDTL